MTDFAPLVCARLADFYLLCTALLLFYCGALATVRRQPELQIALSWGATVALWLLAASLLLPAGVRATPRQWLGRLYSATAATAPQPVLDVTAPPRAIDATIAAPAAVTMTAADLAAVPAASGPSSVSRALLVLLASSWTGLAALAVLWLWYGAWRAGRLVRRAEAAPAWAWAELHRCGGAQAARLLATADAPTAMALGALRPVILLPQAELAEGNEPAVKAAVRHEWAHVAHGDLWLLALQRILGVVLAAHPLYWLLRRHTRAAQELLADAAAAGADPLAYTEQLLAWAGRAAAHGKPPARWPWPPVEVLGLTMWRDAGSLERRIESLLAGQAAPQPEIRPAVRLGGACLLAVLGLFLGGVSLVSEEPQRARLGEVTVLNQDTQRTVAGEDRLGRRFVTITVRPGALTIRVKEYAWGPDPESELTVRDSRELAQRDLELYRLYQRFMEVAERQERAAAVAPAPLGRHDAPTPPPGKVLYPQPQPQPLPAPARTAADSRALAPAAVLIEAQILEVNHERLDAAEEDLGEIIQDTLAGKCTLQGEHIIAACSPQEAAALRQRLEKLDAVRTLSTPALSTLLGQTASIKIGGEHPRLKRGSDQGGDKTGIDFEFVGIQLDVTPRLLPAGDNELALDIKLETSDFRDVAEDAQAPSIQRRAVAVGAKLRPDQVYLVAQRRPRTTGKERPRRTHSLLLRTEHPPAALNAADLRGTSPVTRSYPLRFVPAGRAAARFSEVLGDARVTIKIDERANALTVTADELTQRKAADALAQLDQQPDASQPTSSRTAVLAIELQKLDQLEAEAALEAAKHRLAAIVAKHTAGLTSSRERTAAELALRQAEAELLRRRNPDQPEEAAQAAVLAAEAGLQAARENLAAAMQAPASQDASTERIDLELALRRAEITLRRAQLQRDAVRAAAPARERTSRP